jgi:uroporphyrinogen decarboxylase
MVEGGGSKLFSKVKKWVYGYEEESREVLGMLADTCFGYLSKCIESGA